MLTNPDGFAGLCKGKQTDGQRAVLGKSSAAQVSGGRCVAESSKSLSDCLECLGALEMVLSLVLPCLRQLLTLLPFCL